MNEEADASSEPGEGEKSEGGVEGEGAGGEEGGVEDKDVASGDASSGEGDETGRDVETAEAADGEKGKEGEGGGEEEEGEGEKKRKSAGGEGSEDIPIPDEVVPSVPMHLVLVVAGVAAVIVFVLSLLLGRSLGRGPVVVVEPAKPFEGIEFASLKYDDLMALGERVEKAGNFELAMRIYARAATRKEKGRAGRLWAAFRLAALKRRMGRNEEAAELFGRVASVFNPGTRVWRAAVSEMCSAYEAAGRYADWRRSLYELASHAGCYRDSDAVSAWCAYRLAAGTVNLFFRKIGDSVKLYDLEPGWFGRDEFPYGSLSLKDFASVGEPLKQGLKVERKGVGVVVRAGDVPLAEVLKDLGFRVRVSSVAAAALERRVSAYTALLTALDAAVVVAGQIGLKVEQAKDDPSVVVVSALPGPDDMTLEYVRSAATSLVQDLLLRHPDSPYVPEGYFMLAVMYLKSAHRKVAMEQLDILFRTHPRSKWTLYGRYVAGRAYAESGEWRKAADEMFRIVDYRPEDESLLQRALLWAARYRLKHGDYASTLGAFEDLLRMRPAKEVLPEIYYGMALCRRRLGGDARWVERSYGLVELLFPGTSYARRAAYDLAEYALERGEWRTAAGRFARYLDGYVPDEDFDRRAPALFVEACYRAGMYLYAALAGDWLIGRYEKDGSFADRLLLAVDSMLKAGLEERALRRVNELLAGTLPQDVVYGLMLRKAQALAAMKMYRDAEDVISRLELMGGRFERKLMALRARLAAARGRWDDVVRYVRKGMLAAGDEPTGDAFMKMLGEAFERMGRYADAVAAYGGTLEGGAR